MQKRMIKFPIILIICQMLLIGCGGHISPEEQSAEEQMPDVSDITVTSISENVEINEEAFYSLEHSIQIEIMSGDFSSITDVEFRETVEQQYQWWEESRAIEGMKWRLVDLNGDGIDDLILQEVQTVGESQQHRIVAIFACEEDSASCILWDLNDSTEYTFCGPTGELMYYVDGWGTSIGFASYRHCYYDREWNRLADYVLVVTVVDSSMDGSREEFLEYNSNWIEGHPDMAEDGYYYSRYEIDMGSGEQKEREDLTFEGFREIYEDVMGMEYYSFR